MVRSINDSVLGDAALMKQSVATKAIHNATKMPSGLSEDVLSYMKKVYDPKKRYKKYLHAIHPYKLSQPEQKYYKTAAELNREKELNNELADLMKLVQQEIDDTRIIFTTDESIDDPIVYRIMPSTPITPPLPPPQTEILSPQMYDILQTPQMYDMNEYGWLRENL